MPCTGWTTGEKRRLQLHACTSPLGPPLRCRRTTSQVPVSLRVALSCGWTVVRLARAATPRDAVGDDALDLGLVINRKLLVAGAEVREAAGAAVKATPTAKNFAAFIRADEDELVGRRDVEVFDVQLVMRDDDRLRDAGRDRVGRIDGPDDLALAALVGAPAPRAGRTHEALEDLRVMPRMQNDDAHAVQHASVHALHDFVRNLVV